MASGKTLIPIITENTSIGIIRINASIPVVSFTKAEIVYTTKVFIIENKYTKKINHPKEKHNIPNTIPHFIKKNP